MAQTYEANEILTGDWTIAEITQHVEKLMKLSNDSMPGEISIDCSGIRAIDLSGFQLLYVWLRCLQIKGLRPRLVNIPEQILESQRMLGFQPTFSSEGFCS